MNDIRMIATDIDNTLVGRDGKLTKFTRDTLSECERRGIKVVLTSGRCFWGVKPLCTEAGLTSPVISANGGRADESPEGNIIFEDVIEAETARKVCDRLLAAGCFMTSYTRERIYLMSETNGFGSRSWYRSEAVDKPFPIVRDDRARMAGEGTVRPYKFEAYSDDSALLAELKREFVAMGLSVSGAFAYNLEIMSPGGGKHRAMLAVAKRCGIDPKQIIAFGDGDNDVGMIEHAGIGVAVENAVERLKRAATYIAPHHDDNGVARAIWQYVFGETV